MELVGLVGMSHSPSWDLSPVEGPAKPYVDAVFRARDQVARLMPDYATARELLRPHQPGTLPLLTE